MNDVDGLRRSRLVGPVAYVDFCLLQRRYPDDVYAFVEGEDSKYYDTRISRHVGQRESHFLPCGGKDGVLRVHRMLAGKKHATTMFLVDRDYDDRLGSSDVFVTPCYSIENLYTLPEVFGHILQDEFGLVRRRAEYNRIMKLYIARQQEFHSATLLLNAWLACQRRIARREHLPRLEVSGLKVTKLVSICLESVKPNYDLSTLVDLFPTAPSVNLVELGAVADRLSSLNPRLFFRGKFELQFLRVFVEELKTDRRSEKPRYFNSTGSVKLTVTQNAISELSHYALTPSCLDQYTVARLTSA